jgi:hypothetical protein
MLLLPSLALRWNHSFRRILFPPRRAQRKKKISEFFDIGNIPEADICPAKHVLSVVEGALRTPSSEVFHFFFAAFASLREIFRNSVAAVLRWALRGE